MRVSVRRLRTWLHRRRERRRHVPTEVAEAIRDGIGTRITEGPPGLHSDLYHRVISAHRSARRRRRGP